MTYLSQLHGLVPPAREPVAVDWVGVEARLGPLPSDYKQYVDLYGAGTFDHFLSVYAPGTSNPHLDLLAQAGRQLQAMREVAEAWGPDEVPYELDDGVRGELLPWGVTANGDLCFWVRRQPSADAWTVAVNESRGPDWFTYDGPMTAFLHGVVSGGLLCPLFYPDLPSAMPTYHAS